MEYNLSLSRIIAESAEELRDFTDAFEDPARSILSAQCDAIHDAIRTYETIACSTTLIV
jgi:hypothetical protein